jgi:hypothetical protein
VIQAEKRTYTKVPMLRLSQPACGMEEWMKKRSENRRLRGQDGELDVL